MSDVYLIPKTCTGIHSIFRNIHTVVRSFSKNRCWSEWESRRGPPVVTTSHGRRCAGRVCLGRDAGWNSIGLTGGLGFPRIGSRCWEVLFSKNHWARGSILECKLKIHLGFWFRNHGKHTAGKPYSNSTPGHETHVTPVGSLQAHHLLWRFPRSNPP